MSGLLQVIAVVLGGAGLLHWINLRRQGTVKDAEQGQSVVSSGAETPLTQPNKQDARLVDLIEDDLRGQFTHAGAIRVTARDGMVTLSGSVLQNEHARLLDHVRAFRGVRGVRDELQSQRQRGDLPDVHTGADVHEDEGI